MKNEVIYINIQEILPSNRKFTSRISIKRVYTFYYFQLNIIIFNIFASPLLEFNKDEFTPSASKHIWCFSFFITFTWSKFDIIKRNKLHIRTIKFLFRCIIITYISQ